MVGGIAMIRHERLLRPAWVLKLTNDELGDALDAAHKEAGKRWGEANIMRRLEVLGDEISRREAIGTWTEDDWRMKS
jgi:hypothetical protein